MGDDAVLTVTAMNGQYRIDADPEQDDPWPETIDALTTGEDGWIAVLTGTQHGPVLIRFQLRMAAPESIDSGWQMVGERDLYCEADTVRIHDLFSNVPPHVIAVDPGIYRVRIHVFGRSDAASVSIVEEPIERHFIQMWKVRTPGDPAILVGPDAWATAYQ